MIDSFHAAHQIQVVSSFQDLVSTPFQGDINAMGWVRSLEGDFSEIVTQIAFEDNIEELQPEALLELQLSEAGQLARDILLNDLKLLEAYGASPILTLIKSYHRDEENSFFPIDVYSFHVDRSPVATDTFLCTYWGASSQILPNEQVEQKVLVPGIREELRRGYGGNEAGFGAYLAEHFYDMHYQAKPNAEPISLGLGHLWRLAVDHPGSEVPPCIHRAPKENPGQTRLLLIC